MSHKALVLVGSPGGARSNSSMIGRYLEGRLNEKGWEVELECIYPVIKDEGRTRAVMEKMDNSDLIILSFPLYVDSLPSQMIRFMELVGDRRAGAKQNGQKLMAVCQSGFPESHQNDYALRICSIFAREIGFQWVGGLSVGGGGAIGGRDLIEGGGMLRNLRQALDMSVQALTDGQEVPEEAKRLTDKGLVPSWLYNWMVNRNWKKEARNNEVDPKTRPHAR